MVLHLHLGSSVSAVSTDDLEVLELKVPDNLVPLQVTYMTLKPHFRAEVVALKNIVLNLEKDFKDSVESNLNREVYFRDAVDFKFDKMEESIKDAVSTLERGLRLRDKKWVKQLEQLNDPEASISPPTATTSPVPPTSVPGFPPANHPSTSTTSQTVNRATDGEFCATTPTGPDFDTIFSILPFSRELSRVFPYLPPLHRPTGSKCWNTRHWHPPQRPISRRGGNARGAGGPAWLRAVLSWEERRHLPKDAQAGI
ncbi:Coiled-coil domain-containing protein 78 [Labeo rohita]|uniref:Coiled-coil domain-containing protein 78 n=1 Tax=Labeo rohita TaxID=84645 RepID=A0ABQ8MWH3_LABRO|nr:Coiled-coil domain-containing protein 78 [Labeo rohita]